MPKNLKGGKAYRSGNRAEVKPILHEIVWAEGQAPGRVLKHLGDRNVMLYCNDNKERIAHIRGGLSKKKATIEVGDIVLYSNRGEGLGSVGTDKERGDILEKYKVDLASWEQAAFILENKEWGNFIMLEQEDEGENKLGKYVRVLGENFFKIENFSRNEILEAKD